MKIVFLSTRLSGYLVSCLQEYKRQTNADLLIYAWPNQRDAPFNIKKIETVGQIKKRHDFSNDLILKSIQDFSPDAVLVAGWKDKGYVQICRSLKLLGIPIIAGCDTQWKGSLRQRIASILAPLYVQKFVDAIWVTGERQRYLANSLGYRGDRCWDGYYACNWDSFAAPQEQLKPDHPYFLYVGRYAPEKGLDTLSSAYKAYCKQVKEPWSLICAGAGALRHTLVAAGAEDKGFVQPIDLPALLRGATAFVLPSRFEPWGVVAQEAAASGLPLILSDACGSGAHLLRPYHNGFSFSAGSVAGLTQSLISMHSLSYEQRLAQGKASYSLSKQYTPQRWAQTLSQGLKQFGTDGS